MSCSIGPGGLKILGAAPLKVLELKNIKVRKSVKTI